FSSDNFPIFTAHLALSDDQGVTFTNIELLRFLSAATDDTMPRQRVLGDYVQLKSLDNCFYGVFTGNGVPFGRTTAQQDPIFYKTCLGPQIQVPGNLAVGDTCVGSTNTATLNVCNTGVDNLNVSSISSSNTQFVVTTPSSGYPVVISPDFCFPFQVRFTPTSASTKTSTLTIASNDPVTPSVTVQATGNGGQQDIRVTGSTDFGDICSETHPERTVSMCNVGACNLAVTAATFVPGCSDFSLINNPFPATVSPDSC